MRKKKDRHVSIHEKLQIIKKRVSGKVKLARITENGTLVWNKKTRKMA